LLVFGGLRRALFSAILAIVLVETYHFLLDRRADLAELSIARFPFEHTLEQTTPQNEPGLMLVVAGCRCSSYVFNRD